MRKKTKDLQCDLCSSKEDINFLAANERNIDYDREYRYRFLIAEKLGVSFTDIPGFPKLCKTHLSEVNDLMVYN